MMNLVMSLLPRNPRIQRMPNDPRQLAAALAPAGALAATAALIAIAAMTASLSRR